MNVGLDVSSLTYQRGVSRYTANLAKALMQLPNVQLRLFGYSWRQKAALTKKAQALMTSSRHQLQIQNLAPTWQQLWWRLGLNPVSKTFPDLEVFHSWDWLQPPDKNIPLVSTIHDLAILKYPEIAHPKVLAAHRRSWQILKDRRARIIAVSQATKKDIINLLQIPSWQITVIPEALPAEVMSVEQNLTEDQFEFIKNRLQLDQPYLLFVGTREPRKNLNRLIEAWQPLAKDYQLIIAGEAGWDQTGHQKISGLRFLGQVTDQELSVLYAQAEAFVYPSLDEGFGLPILEAFYHGTPVVATNIPAAVEVAGNAAQFVDPQSVTDLRLGLTKVLGESKIDSQNRLQRMIIRLQMFNWQKVAYQTAQVYQQAILEFNQT